ncbi:MAG: hypothetical protein RIR39_440 [Pseudomonadota bacterium]|jgi:PIN domain nuclease of toxin-antitoxin system
MNEEAILLLDTHIWFWWVSQDNRLPNRLQELISQFDGRVAVSAASVYELTVLAMRKRIVLNRDVDDWIDRATQGVAIDIIAINGAIAQQAGLLPYIHGDPLDRVIIATALHYSALLVSLDSKFPYYEELQNKLVNE